MPGLAARSTLIDRSGNLLERGLDPGVPTVQRDRPQRQPRTPRFRSSPLLDGGARVVQTPGHGLAILRKLGAQPRELDYAPRCSGDKRDPFGEHAVLKGPWQILESQDIHARA